MSILDYLENFLSVLYLNNRDVNNEFEAQYLLPRI